MLMVYVVRQKEHVRRFVVRKGRYVGKINANVLMTNRIYVGKNAVIMNKNVWRESAERHPMSVEKERIKSVANGL